MIGEEVHIQSESNPYVNFGGRLLKKKHETVHECKYI